MIDDMNKYTKGVRERQAELDVKQVAEEMNEPTLTCSEVVERLAAIADECYHGPRDHGCPHGRERRVQELEMLIARAAFFVSFTKAEFNKRGDFDGIYKANCWSQDAEKLLNSEWREQIRKGQK